MKAHFSTRQETDLAEMMRKLQYLEASNDQWKARANSLLRKVAEVTVLQQKLDKKAEAAALMVINTRIFSSPEPKAQGELIVWDSSWRPCVCASVHPCVRPHFQTLISLRPAGQS